HRAVSSDQVYILTRSQIRPHPGSLCFDFRRSPSGGIEYGTPFRRSIGCCGRIAHPLGPSPQNRSCRAGRGAMDSAHTWFVDLFPSRARLPNAWSRFAKDQIGDDVLAVACPFSCRWTIYNGMRKVTGARQVAARTAGRFGYPNMVCPGRNAEEPYSEPGSRTV